MELDEVFDMLELTPGSSIKELNLSYRRLAKKYHPDFNQGKESWAHHEMTRLNLAYEAALEYASCAGGGAKPGPTRGPAGGGTRASPAAVKGRRRPPGSELFRSDFKDTINKVLSALYTYYEYGLENVHRRKEGVRRFRYRECVGGLRKGIELLDALAPGATQDSERENLKVFADFSRAFLQNVLLDRFSSPTSDSFESAAYRHYRDGSSSLDYAIKDVFFGDLLIPVRDGSFYHKIAAGHEELFLVLTRYTRSGWVAETVIKVYLLEMLTKVIGVLQKLRH